MEHLDLQLVVRMAVGPHGAQWQARELLTVGLELNCGTAAKAPFTIQLAAAVQAKYERPRRGIFGRRMKQIGALLCSGRAGVPGSSTPRASKVASPRVRVASSRAKGLPRE